MKEQTAPDGLLRLIPPNRPYLWFLGLALIVVGAAGVLYGCLDGTVSAMIRVLFVLGGVVLLAASVFVFWLLTTRILVFKEKIVVKLRREQEIPAGEIEYIEWTWYRAGQGNCYINLKDGRSVALQRKLFSPALLPVLSEFAGQNGVRQRGLEESEKQK